MEYFLNKYKFNINIKVCTLLGAFAHTNLTCTKNMGGRYYLCPEIRKVSFREGMLPRLHHQQVAKPRSGFRNVWCKNNGIIYYLGCSSIPTSLFEPIHWLEHFLLVWLFGILLTFVKTSGFLSHSLVINAVLPTWNDNINMAKMVLVICRLPWYRPDPPLLKQWKCCKQWPKM